MKLINLIKKQWLACTLLILTAITVLSLYPLQHLPLVPGSDKAHHLISYAALMFPAALRQPKFLWLIALFFISWSGGIELIQPYVNRYGEWLDLLANSVGLLVGFVLAQLIVRYFPSQTA